MRAMRAKSFTGYGDLKLVESPKPPVADERVLVRITAAGVTPLDHTILSGGYPRATAPLIYGGAYGRKNVYAGRSGRSTTLSDRRPSLRQCGGGWFIAVG